MMLQPALALIFFEVLLCLTINKPIESASIGKDFICLTRSPCRGHRDSIAVTGHFPPLLRRFCHVSLGLAYAYMRSEVASSAPGRMGMTPFLASIWHVEFFLQKRR